MVDRINFTLSLATVTLSTGMSATCWSRLSGVVAESPARADLDEEPKVQAAGMDRPHPHAVERGDDALFSSSARAGRAAILVRLRVSLLSVMCFEVCVKTQQVELEGVVVVDELMQSEVSGLSAVAPQPDPAALILTITRKLPRPTLSVPSQTPSAVAADAESRRGGDGGRGARSTPNNPRVPSTKSPTPRPFTMEVCESLTTTATALRSSSGGVA